MGSLLELMMPGLGHIVWRQFGRGVLFLILWSLCALSSLVAASFDARGIFALPLSHMVLALFGVVSLRRFTRGEDLLRPSAGRHLTSLCLAPLVYLGVAAVLWIALARPIVIRSGSMLPSIRTGDMIVAQLFWPYIGTVGLGDIVLVRHQENGRLLLKRIVGIEGDLIEVRQGELYRNDARLSQCALGDRRDIETDQPVVERLEVSGGTPYLVWDQPAFRSQDLSRRVEPGRLFVVGDNRDRSGDSRAFGTVDASEVRARIRVSLSTMRARIDRAPVAARQAAHRRCARR